MDAIRMSDVYAERERTEFLPVRMLNEFVYCPRLFYLEWVEGDFIDSVETIDGRMKHRHVDKEYGVLPEFTISEEEIKNFKIKARSVVLSSDKYGISTRLDMIQGVGKSVSPIEYKRGKEPERNGGVWPSDLIQICAQSIILRDNGYECEEGVIYYFGSKKRLSIPITEELINLTLSEVEKARNLSISGRRPSPLIDSPKCPKCSLVSICLPDEINSLSEQDVNISENEIRRLYPARDDALPVYVQQQGCIIGKRNEVLEMKVDGKVINSVRLMEISQLSIFGNVQVTTQTVHELCRRNISICYFTTGGWFNGITTGMSHKNVQLRILQYSTAEDKKKSILLARRLIEGKIRNCRTLLRRNSSRINRTALEQLQRWSRAASQSTELETLLGIEGSAGRIYFQHFKDMIKSESLDKKFDFENRNRRPPKDPVNALLSFVYALLTKELTVTLLSVGFDPFLGLYHQPRYGKPALALDLMEEFRPLIADSVVIGLINNSEITEKDFIRLGIGTSLTSDGKKKVISAFERRLDTLITHPVFDYKVSYRRILEVQCRLVARWLLGEIKEYPMFCTR